MKTYIFLLLYFLEVLYLRGSYQGEMKMTNIFAELRKLSEKGDFQIEVNWPERAMEWSHHTSYRGGKKDYLISDGALAEIYKDEIAFAPKRNRNPISGGTRINGKSDHQLAVALAGRWAKKMPKNDLMSWAKSAELKTVAQLNDPR